MTKKSIVPPVKVVVQIPCLNEEKTLPAVLESIPKKIAGLDVTILVIDDGSTDQTAAVARRFGVQHFVHHRQRMGLAKSFSDGLDYALSLGADIIVNTDGDNQYPQARIPDLIQPIIDGRAEIVIGDRQTATIAHFGPVKKFFQGLGTKIVNAAAGTNVPDAVSGFRAYSREAALQMIVINSFSYCTETIIHAGRKRLAIASIPVQTNKPTRDSRLFNNMWHHMYMSTRVILKSYFMYQPAKIFVTPAAILGLAGLVPFARYLYLFSTEGRPTAHLQSLLLGAVLFIMSFLFLVLAVIADLIRTNRIVNEDVLYRLKVSEYRQK
jgi:glycosyltransferase involved in cell wall biosynthesis